LPRADGDWRIGKKKFAEKLDYELDAGVTAEQVLKDAEDEANRVRNEMYVIARQLWSRVFPGQVLPPDDVAGRRTTIESVLKKLNQEHGRAENLVRDAQTIVNQVRAFIRSRDILQLPEPDRCAVIEMPEFQRGNTVAFLNPAPRSIPGPAAFTQSVPRRPVGTRDGSKVIWKKTTASCCTC
jgi:hypothetical protein